MPEYPEQMREPVFSTLTFRFWRTLRRAPNGRSRFAAVLRETSWLEPSKEKIACRRSCGCHRTAAAAG
jgi:hypothetical protein